MQSLTAEKILRCTFKLGVEKTFDHKEKTIAPLHISNGPPLRSLIFNHTCIQDKVWDKDDIVSV